MSKETPINVQERLLLEKQTREVAKLIADRLPGRGFILLAFDFGDGANLAYVSNALRPDAIKAVQEWLEKSS
jgi:hypothetical protein